MSLQGLLSEFVLSDDGDGVHIPERTFTWAVILRAVWDSGAGATDVKTTVKENTPARKWTWAGQSAATRASVRRDAIEWLKSESTEFMSLRWYLELLNIDHDAVQPKLISQIGMKHKRKPYTCTSRGEGFYAAKKKLRNAKL